MNLFQKIAHQVRGVVTVFILVTVLAVGFSTPSYTANAQLSPNVNTVFNNTISQVITALDSEEETNNVETSGVCEAVVCKPGGDIYLANPGDCGSFYQCSNGVPVLQPCPAGLVFNPNLNVCDYPSNYTCQETCQ